MAEEAPPVEEDIMETGIVEAPITETSDRDEPLNAEEVTVLVVSFLERLDKVIVTPPGKQSRQTATSSLTWSSRARRPLSRSTLRPGR